MAFGERLARQADKDSSILFENQPKEDEGSLHTPPSLPPQAPMPRCRNPHRQRPVLVL